MRNPTLIADELRSMANTGLLYAANAYDQHRYIRLLEISSELVHLETSVPRKDIMKAYFQNLTHIAPLVGADAVVIQQEQLLLIQRKDSGLWALPGGLIDVGETAAQAAVRELFEETGLTGVPVRLLGVFDSNTWRDRGMMHFFQIITLLELQGGELKSTPETLGAGFFPLHQLPELDEGHREIVPRILEVWKKNETHFDLHVSTQVRSQDTLPARKKDRSLRFLLTRLLVRVLFLLQSKPLNR